VGVLDTGVLPNPDRSLAARQAQVTGRGALGRQLVRGDGLRIDAPISEQVRCDQRAELVDPASYRPWTDIDAADVQPEPETQPDRMMDHVRREPVPRV